MDIGSWIRRSGFWICDKVFLKGIHGKFYKEAKEAYYSGTSIKETNRKLENLLKHAAATTEYYSNYKNIKNLEQFPIVTKIEYQSRWKEFISSKYANDKKCHLECTSGSTGTPLEILYDPIKTHKRNSVSIFLNTLADYRIGDKQIFLRIWVKRIQKNIFQKKILNMIPYETSNMDDKHLEEICKIIEKKHIRSIVGYASSLTTLCLFIKENKIDCSKFKVKSITPISEALSPYIRNELKKQFSCTVSSIYGAEEFGTIAVQLKNSDEYYVDTSGVFLEILKLDEDIPADDGELGRLVITDLYNYAFPLIRYDNGDTVIRKTIHMSEGRYKQYFTQIYGRRSDLIYGTDGTIRSPFLLTNKLWGIQNIVQWKFIQTGKNSYHFILNGNREKIDEDYIQNLLIDDLGNDANISFEYVDEIPVLKSGKRKYIENQYRKE